MIRVLQVVTHMNRGGLESMLMNYYRHTDREKVQFDFLTHRPYDGDFGEEISALGGTVFHLPPLNPFGTSYKKALRGFFASHPEYGTVHVHLDCMSGVVLKEAKRAGIPVRVAHSHSSSQDKDLKYPLKLFFRRSIPEYATDLFACGEEAGKWMFCGAPFTVLNNAIDAAAFSFDPITRQAVRKSFGFSDHQLVVGHVGRFSYPKNHEYLIDCFDALLKRAPDARLLLVGDDKNGLGAQIREKVRTLGIENTVVFAGLRSDVSDLMQAMDVFVFPSRYEGLPVTLIEAQAAGLPCLISDKVPIECKKTDLVRQLPLAEAPAFWADAILSASGTERKNVLSDIRAAGFDVTENALWLQNYYLKQGD